ncbi:MAG: polymer-forming cytoskeletal protein [Candidatus Eisenbacteria bacterium]|nr:polymer-forming cytoskeletal protein [Candidatus Eisenbacteria bacterium]
MFNRKSSPEPVMPAIPRGDRTERKEQSFLQSGVKLDGDLTAEGDLRIEGRVTGTIRVKGLLTLGPKAEVEGVVTGGEVVVHGKLRGTVQADHRIHLAREANVTGDLYCSALVIEDGVHFQGSSNMGEKAVRKEERLGAASSFGSATLGTASSTPAASSSRAGEPQSASGSNPASVGHTPKVAAQSGISSIPQTGGPRSGAGPDRVDSGSSRIS